MTTVINDLEILREYKKNHRTYVEFKCVCGSTGSALRKHVLSGHTKSCGCRRAKIYQPKSNSLLPVTSPENKLYNQYVRDANKRGIDFKLKKSVFIALTKQPCYYCGSLPTNNITYSNVSILWNGIDRINSNGAYTKDNVRSCCTNCNRAKHYLSENDFMELVKRIYVYNFGPTINRVNSVNSDQVANTEPSLESKNS
jgi:hypothetical protein